MIVLLASCTASTNVVSPGAAWAVGDARPANKLARGGLGNKLPALREALQGRVARHHRLLVAELLAHLDYLDEAIQRLSGGVAQMVAPFSPLLALLCTIPGVDRCTAEVILAEIGVDMTRFPTAGHLASWAGLCPGTGESAGKHLLGQDPQGLQVATDHPEPGGQRRRPQQRPYLAAHYAGIKGRRGHKRAIVAVAHPGPGDRLAPAHPQPAVHRPGRRLLPGASAQPGVQEPAGPPAGAHGPQGHLGAGPSRLTKSPHQGHWARTGGCPDRRGTWVAVIRRRHPPWSV